MTIAIIGNGRVGSALAQRSDQHSIEVLLVDRHTGWDQLSPTPGDPIFVATRNDDLDAVVQRLPSARAQDIVCIQNGMLRPWLAKRQLAGVTRGLLFFAVPRRGADIEVGPASPFVGPHAASIVTWLNAMEVPAEVVDDDGFKKLELEKLIWNAAFGLLCQHLTADVGTVVTDHRDVLRQLVEELQTVGEAQLGVHLQPQPLLQRLMDYSLSIPTYRGSVKEWPWRNGWFVDVAAQQGRATPLHHRLLAEAGVTPQE